MVFSISTDISAAMTSIAREPESDRDRASFFSKLNDIRKSDERLKEFIMKME